MYTLLIRNGTLVDGTGQKPFQADLAVADGKIVRIAPHLLGEAERVIDATGRYVTPGFIDLHRHADLQVFRPGFGEAELRQGLTTIVNGNCGLSVVPCLEPYREELLTFLQPVVGSAEGLPYFTRFGEYLELVRRQPLPLNVGMLVGNGTVRAAVKGYEGGRMAAGEVDAARGQLRESLEAGALGVSLGIVYAPEYHYDVEGFVEVLEPMKQFGVPLVTHIRGEGDLFCRSVEEVLEIARRLEVPLHISHFKCIGKRNWGHEVARALELLEQANAAGMQVDCDVYPYTAGSTQLIQILPPDYLEGGVPEITRRLRDPDCREHLRQVFSAPSQAFENLVNAVGWENIRCSTLTLEKYRPYQGKDLAEIARMRGMDPCDCACEMLAEEDCKISMVDFITCEEDIRTILQSRFSSVISDSVYPTGGVPHPRLYGTFPRVLIEYVRKSPVLTLEQAIHKMTGKPAGVFRLGKKGLLREGWDADLNLFRLERLETKATYEDPCQLATGFDDVIVGGQIAVENDRLTGVPCGRLVTRL